MKTKTIDPVANRCYMDYLLEKHIRSDYVVNKSSSNNNKHAYNEYDENKVYNCLLSSKQKDY